MHDPEDRALCVKRHAKAARCVGMRQPLQRKAI
jgi:hypothetical protein